jgi:hypothetical protein
MQPTPPAGSPLECRLRNVVFAELVASRVPVNRPALASAIRKLIEDHRSVHVVIRQSSFTVVTQTAGMMPTGAVC